MVLHQEMPGPEVQVKARAIPGGADHDADGGELVLGLNDAVARLAGFRVVAELAAVTGEGLGQRGGGRDGVPGGHGRSAVYAAQCRRAVSFQKDPVASGIGTPDLESDRRHVIGRVVPAMCSADVGLQQLLLAFVLLGDQLLRSRKSRSMSADSAPT